MRPIKFRAWDREQEVMIESDRAVATIVSKLICGNPDLHSAGVNERDRPKYEVMQWTGFKDEKGIDIYYDDIVLNLWGNHVRVSVPLMACWLIESGGSYGSVKDIEVIGNIYQHKELLK